MTYIWESQTRLILRKTMQHYVCNREGCIREDCIDFSLYIHYTSVTVLYICYGVIINVVKRAHCTRKKK